MKLTLAQWRELEALKTTAQKALDAFSTKALDLGLATDDKVTREYLVKLHNRTWEAEQAFAACDVHVCSEWMGGDSSDPKNFKLREPQSTGLSNRRYFDASGNVEN